MVERIEVILGNHDGNLKELLKGIEGEKRLRFHKKSFQLGDLAFFHGHAWPQPKAFTKKYLVMSHNHPTVELPQGIGVSIFAPCWVRGSTIEENILKQYPEVKIPDGQELIMMPSVVEVNRGTPVNAQKTDLLGPILKNGLVNIETAEVYLLNGTYLGNIGSLRML